ncbi:MAG: hypothetical protein ABIJ96_15300 [Elusimicrobiota bacterium]
MILTNCRELARRSTNGEFDNASWITKLIVRMHLMMCGSCARYSRQLERISQAVCAQAERSVDPEKLVLLRRRINDRLTRSG